MKVILYGATGMVGQGVLRECRLDPGIDEILSIGRSGGGARDEKLREIVVPDLFDVKSYQDSFTGFDACFFCLGVTAAGLDEAAYRHITYDLTLAVGRAMAEINPGLTFVYVSGAGTDPSGRAMWARVKGKTETDLLALPFHAYMLRPGVIVPRHGERSRTRFYRLFYAGMRPLYPLLRRLGPGAVTSTDRLGRAMIVLARDGAPTPILDSRAINALA